MKLVSKLGGLDKLNFHEGNWITEEIMNGDFEFLFKNLAERAFLIVAANFYNFHSIGAVRNRLISTLVATRRKKQKPHDDHGGHDR